MRFSIKTREQDDAAQHLQHPVGKQQPLEPLQASSRIVVLRCQLQHDHELRLDPVLNRMHHHNYPSLKLLQRLLYFQPQQNLIEVTQFTYLLVHYEIIRLECKFNQIEHKQYNDGNPENQKDLDVICIILFTVHDGIWAIFNFEKWITSYSGVDEVDRPVYILEVSSSVLSIGEVD